MNLKDNIGFVVLCPDLNIGGLKTTISSIKVNFPNASFVCVIGNKSTKEDVEEISKICPVKVGKNTITSLINCGMAASSAKWNCLVMAGVLVRYVIFNRLCRFLDSDMDVIYPVVNLSSWSFEKSSLNGFFVNRNTFKSIGDFDEEESLETCRLYWAGSAIEQGCKLKGIVGLKL